MEIMPEFAAWVMPCPDHAGAWACWRPVAGNISLLGWILHLLPAGVMVYLALSG
jgi:hypothetical protein